ncbi:hypothetical protein NPN15_33735, partial [Bacillus cereus]|nr:hypothetical protein [Bacillus cereus]
YKPKDFEYKAYINFPDVYIVSFIWGNPRENVIHNEDHSEPYVRISNDGYINRSVVVGDRMVSEVERITNSIITDKYWG